MNYAGFGYPVTKASGFSKAIPTYGKAVAPGFGKFGKPFGKPFAKPFGKPFGKVGGFGFPATKYSGFNYAVPATTVVTGPSAI